MKNNLTAQTSAVSLDRVTEDLWIHVRASIPLVDAPFPIILSDEHHVPISRRGIVKLLSQSYLVRCFRKCSAALRWGSIKSSKSLAPPLVSHTKPRVYILPYLLTFWRLEEVDMWRSLRGRIRPFLSKIPSVDI